MNVSEAIVPYESKALSLDEIKTMADIFVKSGYFDDVRDQAKGAVKIMAGQELGIGPIAAMRSVYVDHGQIGLSASLVAALIKRSGRYDYRVIPPWDDDNCELEFYQDGKAVGRYQLTWKQAQESKMHQQWDKATNGWKDKQTWKSYRRNMLFARCLTGGGRMYCPDVFLGPVYTPEELNGAQDADYTVIEPTVKAEADGKPEPGKQTVAESKQTIVPKINGKVLTPDQLRQSIAFKVAAATDQDRAAEIATDQIRWIGGCMSKIEPDQQKRISALEFIVGKSSTHDLNRAEAVALMAWLGIPKGGFEPLRAEAATEMQAVIAAHMQAGAVGTLPGMDDDEAGLDTEDASHER
jgi:hypothetical protein